MRFRTLVMAVLLSCLSAGWAQSRHTTLTVVGDHFEVNGKPVQILSGEMHYARIPRAYWRTRIKMAKAMGLNTIATYVFWNVHEPRPGVYDFAGNNDLAAFIKTAQEEGMYVLLRAGPYACAEWEFGGYPAWLMKAPQMQTALRTDDPAYMVPVERWIKRLHEEVNPLLSQNGGPIVAVQVENEYGNFGSDKKYLAHMLRIFQDAGFQGSFLYTVDPSKSLEKGSLPELPTGVNFGTGNAKHALDALASFRPGSPLFVSEYWPGWFDHWGHPHETRDIEPQLKDLNSALSRKASINIYMFHGGTSFGFMAGASWTDDQYLPDVTSYDYDAPLDEAGHPTPKFFAYRDVIAKHTGGTPPAPPAVPPVIAVPEFSVGKSVALWDHLPAPVRSNNPLTMEALGQAYGFVLYRKHLDVPVHGDLVLNEVHDYALVYVDGKLAGTIDRRLKQDRIAIATDKAARLDILVENMGRINSTRMMRGENKGITHDVSLSGKPLTEWLNYSLPFIDVGAWTTADSSSSQDGPHMMMESFSLKETGDTFLDMRAFGKGAVWINGHALGKYWDIGPQMTLFVPGPWLRKGRNQVVVLDLFAAHGHAKLTGLTKPILDAVPKTGK